MQTYRIDRLGHQGDGIAEGPIYAPRVLPGEVVTGVAADHVLEQIRIVTPSPDRVTPPCRHYNSCGGCQLQHASDGFVADWKVDVVRHALAAQGIDATFRPILTSPERSRRRAVIAARRTKKGAMAGFHARASDVIADIIDCPVLAPDLQPAIGVAKDLAMVGTSRKAALAVTATVSAHGLDLSVSGGKALDGALRMALAEIADRSNLARLVWDGELIAARHPAIQAFGAARVVPPPGAFLQATRQSEAALLSTVREITEGARRIADLFCGCGTFGLALADRSEVHAVEAHADMVAALDQGWRQAQGLKKVTTEARDLFRNPLTADDLAPFDAIVLDPPRAGAQAQILEIAQARVPVIAYVSCNPVSFARDARVLAEAGYRIGFVQVVDQFRWSTHVELAAAFRLDHMAGDSRQ